MDLSGNRSFTLDLFFCFQLTRALPNPLAYTHFGYYLQRQHKNRPIYAPLLLHCVQYSGISTVYSIHNSAWGGSVTNVATSSQFSFKLYNIRHAQLLKRIIFIALLTMCIS